MGLWFPPYALASWASRIFRRKWLCHSFIVIDYEDEEKKKGSLSLELRPDYGYVMRFGK